MPLTLLPDLGDLLRLSAQYNAATLVELALGLGAHEVLWLSGPDPEHPARDSFGAARVGLVELAPDWAWAHAEQAKLREFAAQYPQGRERLRAAHTAERELAAALQRPLSLAQMTPLLEATAAYHAGLAAALGEGPGTAWQERRLDELAAQLEGRHGVALAALDDVPGLLARLPQARCCAAEGFVPGEASRLRALADRAALLSDDDDFAALLAALERETGDAITPQAELYYHAGGLYLAAGELPSARARLEQAAHALSDLPRSLPGLVLARLGQVRDLQGERGAARRSYQAALALQFAPQVARQTAQAGLQAPFLLATSAQ